MKNILVYVQRYLLYKKSDFCLYSSVYSASHKFSLGMSRSIEAETVVGNRARI
jgi:hypothetical protein